MANPARDIADAFTKPSGESMELSVKARMGVTATLFAACMAWNMYLPAENTKDSFNSFIIPHETHILSENMK